MFFILNCSYNTPVWLYGGENSQFIQIYREKFVVKQPENYETVDSDLEMRITPAKRVTSSTWGPPPRCKQALKGVLK